jgi:hypothetical protein
MTFVPITSKNSTSVQILEVKTLFNKQDECIAFLDHHFSVIYQEQKLYFYHQTRDILINSSSFNMHNILFLLKNGTS